VWVWLTGLLSKRSRPRPWPWPPRHPASEARLALHFRWHAHRELVYLWTAIVATAGGGEGGGWKKGGGGCAASSSPPCSLIQVGGGTCLSCVAASKPEYKPSSAELEALLHEKAAFAKVRR